MTVGDTSETLIDSQFFSHAPDIYPLKPHMASLIWLWEHATPFWEIPKYWTHAETIYFQMLNPYWHNPLLTKYLHFLLLFENLINWVF